MGERPKSGRWRALTAVALLVALCGAVAGLLLLRLGAAAPSQELVVPEEPGRELHAERWLAAYGFIGLVDQEDVNALPQLPGPRDPEFRRIVFFGPRGVSALTGPDAEVDVRVVAGPTRPAGTLRGEGEITVGGGGLLLTDGPGFEPVPWPQGPVTVRVYARRSALGQLWGSVIRSPELGTTHLTFVLDRRWG